MSKLSMTSSQAQNRDSFDRNLVVATVVGPMLSFASAPLLAIALGVEGRGTLAAVVSGFMILRFMATFGGQEAALGAASWGELGVGGASRTVTRWIAPIAIGVSVVGWFAAPIMFPLDSDAVSVFRSVSILIPIASVSDGLRFALVADRRSMPVVTHTLAPNVVRLAGAIALVVFSIDSVLVGAWASTGGVIAGFLAVAVAAWPMARGAAVTRAVERRFRRFALDLAPGQVARLGNRRLDQVLLGSVAGRRELGLYVVAVALAEVADLFTRSIRELAMRAQATKNGQSLEHYFRLGLVLFLFAVLGLALSVPVALSLLFPSNFAGALWPAEILLLAGLANYVRDVLGVFLVTSDHARTESMIQASTLVLAIIALLLLGGPLGAVGASIAALLSYSVGALMVIARYRRTRPDASLRDLVPRVDDVRNAYTLLATR